MSTILIVGYGSIGRRHHKNILNYKKKNTIYILTKQNFKNTKQTLFIKSIKQIKLKLDYAFICNDSTKHLKYIDLLQKKANKIFVEKPLSNSGKYLSELYKKYKKKKIKIFVGYNLIFLQSLIRLKKILKNEKILKISVKTNFNLRLWRRNINYKKSVSALKKKGGGVMLELSHDIHYLVWLIGNPTWISCFYSKISNLKIDTEDCAIINIGFKKIISNIQIDFINMYNQRNMEILTHKNYYQWNYLSNSIKKYDQKSKKLKLIFRSPFKKNYTYMTQLKYFFKENNLEKIYKNFKMAVTTSLILDAARKSKKNNMKKEFLQI